MVEIKTGRFRLLKNGSLGGMLVSILSLHTHTQMKENSVKKREKNSVKASLEGVPVDLFVKGAGSRTKASRRGNLENRKNVLVFLFLREREKKKLVRNE